jgi:hypothetical protein
VQGEVVAIAVAAKVDVQITLDVAFTLTNQPVSSMLYGPLIKKAYSK